MSETPEVVTMSFTVTCKMFDLLYEPLSVVRRLSGKLRHSLVAEGVEPGPLRCHRQPERTGVTPEGAYYHYEAQITFYREGLRR